MIGDNLTYYKSYRGVTAKIISAVHQLFTNEGRLCIAIGGESGCGKTSLAYALLLDIQEQFNSKGMLFHADDYFFLPPKDNHNARVKDINHVGLEEVNLKLLDKHINHFINSDTPLTKPLVNYEANTILTETTHPKTYKFCIVEGTYTMTLLEPSYKIFIKKNYKDTLSNRLSRARDIMDNFNENVLEIEHKLIKQHAKYADMIV